MNLISSKSIASKNSDYSNKYNEYNQNVEIQSNANNYNNHFTKTTVISLESKKLISITLDIKEIENKKKHLEFNLSNR